MIRIGNFAIGRITDVAHLMSLLKYTEKRIKDLGGAQNTIINEMYRNMEIRVRKLEEVFEKERNTGMLLESMKEMDLKLKDYQQLEIRFEALRIRVRDVEVKLNMNTLQDR